MADSQLAAAWDHLVTGTSSHTLPIPARGNIRVTFCLTFTANLPNIDYIVSPHTLDLTDPFTVKKFRHDFATYMFDEELRDAFVTEPKYLQPYFFDVFRSRQRKCE